MRFLVIERLSDSSQHNAVEYQTEDILVFRNLFSRSCKGLEFLPSNELSMILTTPILTGEEAWFQVLRVDPGMFVLYRREGYQSWEAHRIEHDLPSKDEIRPRKMLAYDAITKADLDECYRIVAESEEFQKGNET